MTADVEDTRRVRGFCGLCIARCGTIATVENGRFTRLDPDPSHPTGAAICAKGRAAPELVYSKERLTRPLRRRRPKGDADPGWEEISWDAALDETAAAMRRLADRFGPESIAFSQASPVDHGHRQLRWLRAAADARVRHPEPGDGTRPVRMGTRLCHALCVRSRQRGHGQWRRGHAGYRALGLPDPVGLQSLHVAADARHRHGRGLEAWHEADRGRSAQCRPRQQGGCLAARAPRDGRGIGSRPRQRDDRARLVRQSVHPRLEQWTVTGALRHRSAAARERPGVGRRCQAVSGVECAGQAAGCLRSGHRPLRRGQRVRRA